MDICSPRFLVMGENIKNLGQNSISSPIFNILPHYEKPGGIYNLIFGDSSPFSNPRLFLKKMAPNITSNFFKISMCSKSLKNNKKLHSLQQKFESDPDYHTSLSTFKTKPKLFCDKFGSIFYDYVTCWQIYVKQFFFVIFNYNSSET